MRNILSVLVVIAFTLGGCKEKDNPLEKYDRGTLLKSLADNVIVPSYTSFSVEADSLYAAAVIFTANGDVVSLLTLQNQWKKTVDTRIQCELYKVEYAEVNSIDAQIASFPANFAVIETEISGTQPIDENFIASTGTTRKGFAAVEYLIVSTTKSNQQIVDDFTASKRRQDYLLALCAHIKTNAKNLKSEWVGGNSYNSFVSKTNMDIGGSLSLVVNALVANIEFVRRGKIGKPCGIEATTNTDYSSLEYPITPYSLECIKGNIAAWRKCFTSAGNTGIDDYADAVGAEYNGEKLTVEIMKQLDLCEQKANAINGSLESVAKTDINKVKELHLEIKKLTVLTKVDLSSNLGVTITYSDNDGD